MGMFDWIECEFPLPGLSDPTKIEFQSKDTDAQYCEYYKITREGRLLYRRVTKYEDRSDPNAKPGSLESVCGCMTPVDWIWEDTHFHGIINFYGDKHSGELLAINLKTGEDMNHPGESPEWFDYDAKFTDGQLTEVTRNLTTPAQ